MILFILMPFIGGYIGYTYAPAKVLEVEKIIVRKPADSTPPQIEESVVQEFRREKFDLYTNPSNKFTFAYPVSWLLAEDLENNERVSVSPMSTSTQGTENVEVTFSIKTFTDFYPSAIEHGYLKSNYDTPLDCVPIVIDGFGSSACSSAVVEGVTYIVPLVGHLSSGEAVYIRDTVMNEKSFAVINTFISLVD